jgi:hypothetical protein
MHFPPVRASGYPYAGVLSLRKPVNNTASQQAADQTFTQYFFDNKLYSFPLCEDRGNYCLKKNYSLFNVNIMNLFFLHPDTKNLKDKSEKHSIIHNEPVRYVNEGSEFLDDAIRMHDQPFMYTEESVAAGCPENLL